MDRQVVIETGRGNDDGPDQQDHEDDEGVAESQPAFFPDLVSGVEVMEARAHQSATDRDDTRPRHLASPTRRRCYLQTAVMAERLGSKRSPNPGPTPTATSIDYNFAIAKALQLTIE